MKGLKITAAIVIKYKVNENKKLIIAPNLGILKFANLLLKIDIMWLKTSVSGKEF